MLGFASPHGKAAPLPHTGMQRLRFSPGHIPQASPARTITQTLGPDPVQHPQQPSQRDRPHRCNTPSSRAWPCTWTPTPSSQLQLRLPLCLHLFPLHFGARAAPESGLANRMR